MQLGIITPFTTDGLAQATAYGFKNAEFCVNVDADIPAFLATVPALRETSKKIAVFFLCVVILVTSIGTLIYMIEGRAGGAAPA